MIKDIQIKNFKGIKELNIDDFKRVNLFVGENNSCKTTILKALKLLMCAGSIQQIPILLNLEKFKQPDENYWKSYFYNLKTNSNIEIIVDRDENKQIKLDISPSSNIEVISEAKSGFSATKISEEGNVINALALNYDIKSTDKIFKIIYKFNYEENKKENEFGITHLNNSVENNDEYKEDVDSIYIASNENFEYLSRNLYIAIYKKKQQSEIIEVLKRIEPELINIVPIANELYCDMGKNFEEYLNLNTMGEGFVKLFAILVIFYNYKNGIIFIDEIENGFHYKTLDLLWEVVLKAAKDFNIQLFATTHSIECAAAMSRTNQEKYKNEDDIRLYRTERVKDNIEIVKITAERLFSVIEEGWEIR